MKNVLALLALTAVLVPFTVGCMGDASEGSDEGDEIASDEPAVEEQAAAPVPGPIGPGTITSPKPPMLSCSMANGVEFVIVTKTGTGDCTVTLKTKNCKSNGDGGCICEYEPTSATGPGCTK